MAIWQRTLAWMDWLRGRRFEVEPPPSTPPSFWPTEPDELRAPGERTHSRMMREHPDTPKEKSHDDTSSG